MLSATIPNSAPCDDPVTSPVLVKVPPPFANRPTIPPVVFVALVKLTLRLFVAFAPAYKAAIPLPAGVPEYL